MKTVLSDLEYENILNGYMAFTEDENLNKIIKLFENFILDLKESKITNKILEVTC